MRPLWSDGDAARVGVSRNLLRTSCARCQGVVFLDEAARLITEEDAGCYFEEYEGMKVAAATCRWCGARYLAWVEASPKLAPQFRRSAEPGLGFFDLSYRTTFDDEGSAKDLPPATINFARGELVGRANPPEVPGDRSEAERWIGDLLELTGDEASDFVLQLIANARTPQ
jgi:hypothetical protein